MRTTLDVDERLLRDTMKALGTKTKRETVEQSLREALRTKRIQELLAMQGKGYGMTLREFLRSRTDE
jgi:Arc/MetJ family transcription regulator